MERAFRNRNLFILICASATGLTPAACLTGKTRNMPENTNLAAIIQSLIDHPTLDRYFHADVRPERKPLVILLDGAPASALSSLQKFGQPVKAADPGHSGPVLAITIGKLQAGATRVEFSYEVEGIGGHAVFAEEAGKPVLRDISVSER
jgi:hypothetical protein